MEKTTETVSSYVGQLKEAGLFETREKVDIKLKVINKLVEAIDRVNADLHEELSAVVGSMLLDLGVVVLKEEQEGILFDGQFDPLIQRE